MVEISDLSKILLSQDSLITDKMRALFTLRNIDTPESSNTIALALKDKSILLKHEVAYVLGQMVHLGSIEILKKTLSDVTEDEIVRHECAEALGNYENVEGLTDLLQKFTTDQSKPVAETCYIALKKLASQSKIEKSIFLSRDPAYPLEADLETVKNVYLDPKADLYQRYAAMFYLRDLQSDIGVEILVKGFTDESALFKHEIAFVLGQMGLNSATEGLEKVLCDLSQHGMVRHEAAEALGAIGSIRSKNALVPHLHCSVDVVRESVEVALCIHHFKDDDKYFLD